MGDKRVLSNKRVTVWVGPANSIADYKAPKKSEIAGMLNVSEAIKWDGFDFNIKASSSDDDRALTDAAGAKTRSYAQFGGSIAFFSPKASDTSSIYRQARTAVSVPRTMLAVVVRTVTLNSAGVAEGDEVNAYRVMTDATSQVRGKASYYYTVNFLPQDLIGVNAVVAPATAVAPTVTVAAGTVSGSAGSIVRLRAVYQGVNVTIGATWASSNQAAATVTRHGIVQMVGTGTANITATYPGSTASTATAITVS